MMPIITRRRSPERQQRGSASAYRVVLRFARRALRLASPQWPSSDRRVSNPTADHQAASDKLPLISNLGFRRPARARRLLERRTETDRKICGGGTSCVEARDWAALGATDRMVGGSQDPLLLWRRITPVSRVAALRAAGHRGRGSQPPGKAVETPSPP